MDEKNTFDAIIDIAVESYRLRSVFNKVLAKLDYDDANRYASQFKWFLRKVEKSLNELGLSIVDIEGKRFDVGMPVTPLNIDDFDGDEELFIEEIIEPIIMDNNSNIIKSGTAILGRIMNE